MSRRNTGPTKAVRELVIERAQGLCERCGLHPGQQHHHRHPRKAGGTRRVWINQPANLLWLHSQCHADVESNRLQAIADGFLIPDGYLAVDVPVRLHYGRQKLTDDGGTIPVPDPCPLGCAVWTSEEPCDCKESP
jgi:hypothetical protein